MTWSYKFDGQFQVDNGVGQAERRERKTEKIWDFQILLENFLKLCIPIPNSKDNRNLEVHSFWSNLQDDSN